MMTKVIFLGGDPLWLPSFPNGTPVCVAGALQQKREHYNKALLCGGAVHDLLRNEFILIRIYTAGSDLKYRGQAGLLSNDAAIASDPLRPK